MLKLECTIHTERWPLVSITVIRESRNGRIVTQEKVQYDLTYSKAEVMCHNALRAMVEEVIKQRKQDYTPEPPAQQVY